MPIDKPKLDRAVLESHGITFSEVVYRPESPDLPQHDTPTVRLPEHVESIREALLRFGALLPESRRKFFEKEEEENSTVVDSENIKDYNVKPPESAYLKQENRRTAWRTLRRYRTMTSDQAEAEMEQNQEVAGKAQQKVDSKVNEANWSKFMTMYIFKEFDDVLVEATEYDYLFDQWALETDAHWNEAHKHANYDKSITRPTGPKPDLTYAFPINQSLNHLAEGFREHDSVTNFSLKVLGELRGQGLISAPLSGLSNWVQKNNFEILRSHLMCFPWAVVELKPSMVPQSEINFAYCQAANGTSAALTLFEKLRQHAGGTDERIPPVVAFTCIGPFIRAWLAYSRTPQEKSRCHRMVCIWSGTLTTTWGVIATRQIVKNMVFWASRVLRPHLSGYISQIRLNKHPKRSDPIVSHDRWGSMNNHGQSHKSTQTDSPISEELSTQGDSSVAGSPSPSPEGNTANLVESNMPAAENQSVQRPSSTQETVLVQEDIPRQELKEFHRRDLSQENVTNQGENLVRETSPTRRHTPSPSEVAIEGNSRLQEHTSPKSQTADGGGINPAPETATTKDLSVPQTPIPDIPRSKSGENASETSSPVQNQTPVDISHRRILIPKSRRAKISRIGSFPTSFSRYDFGVGLGNQPAPMETGDTTNTTTLPRKRNIFNFPKVEKTTSQEHEAQHDGQETVPRTHEDTQSISEADGRQECSAKTRSEASNLNAAVGTIYEHDADAPSQSESADSYTSESRNELNDLASALHTIELNSVFESHDPKNARHKDVADPFHETQAYLYHVYRFSDAPNWILTDALPESPATASDKSHSEYLEDNPSSGSSADQSEYVPSEYVPSEATAFSEAEDHEDGTSIMESLGESETFSAREDSDPNESFLRSTNESEALLSDEPSESGDYEPSITESKYSDSSDSSDSPESETPKDSSDVLDKHGSMLNESATNNIFLGASGALWGSEFVQLQTIRDIVDGLSGERLHDIVWSALAPIKRTRNDPTSHPRLAESDRILRILSEVIGLDGTNTIDRDDLNIRGQWQSIDKALDTIQKSDIEFLRELCFAALACWDSPALFEVLWTDSEQPSEGEYLSIGKEALEMIYSQPVKCELEAVTEADSVNKTDWIKAPR